MAAALVQSKSAAQNVGNATVSATWDTPCTAGNLIGVIVGSDDYSTGTPSGWTLSTGCSQQTFLGHYLYWKVAAGGETSQNVTIGSAAPSCWITFEYSGLSASPYDISAGQLQATSTTTYTTPAITPTSGDRLLIATMGGTKSTASTTMSTWLNSFTERQDVATTLGSGTRDNIGLADLAVTANGSTAYSTGVTFNAVCQSKTGIIIAFKVAAAGGGVVGTVFRSPVIRGAPLF